MLETVTRHSVRQPKAGRTPSSAFPRGQDPEGTSPDVVKWGTLCSAAGSSKKSLPAIHDCGTHDLETRQ